LLYITPTPARHNNDARSRSTHKPQAAAVAAAVAAVSSSLAFVPHGKQNKTRPTFVTYFLFYLSNGKKQQQQQQTSVFFFFKLEMIVPVF
jgi:ABC-type phosphate transport system substrate-binding protein